jgi:hypothetical protein
MRVSARSALLMAAPAMLALGLAACGGRAVPTASASDSMHNGAMQMTAATPAADLRSALDRLLAEHVTLAAAATGAALDGQNGEFEAAAAALDANSVDISRAIGSVYGADAEAAFLPLWRSHIGMVVDYTVGKATNDQAKQDKAINDLVQYTEDLGAFLNAANPNLSKESVAGLVKDHALTLKDVIDAQAAGDDATAYMALRKASAHMAHIAEALASAIAAQFPERFA